jgi:hypothetical protein
MSQTAICNLALLRIGIAQPIADISEASVTARACRAVYTRCIEEMLRERPWPFAIRQVQLAVVSEQTFGDWFYSYRYPVDFLNVHRLVQVSSTVVSSGTIYTVPSVGTPSVKYAVGSDSQGKLIHTNLSSAYAIGTEIVTDVGLFDPLFSSALAWKIASEIAISLTKDVRIAAMAANMYDRVVSEAAATAHNESKSDPDVESGFMKARE